MSQPVIDFKELESAVPGEGLEQLVRRIGQRIGLSPVWSGRGSDSGRDLTFTEMLSGPLTKEKVTWLVSCKEKSKSGESVKERDLPAPGIIDKLKQHNANGFLLVTTTTVSTAAKALLDGIDISNEGDIHTLVWDVSDLTSILLEPNNKDLLRQFLPQSYKRVMESPTLEDAILPFREELPVDVFNELMRLVNPYSKPSLSGKLIWPYSSTAASTIDLILDYILIKQDLEIAVEATFDIEFDAFIEFVSQLHKHYPKDCFAYLSAIVLKHNEKDIIFNAAQFLFDHYEISPDDLIIFSTQLDSEALTDLYSAEVSIFIVDELLQGTSFYSLHSVIDNLSDLAYIELINIITLNFDVSTEQVINFSGYMAVDVSVNLDDDKFEVVVLPGSFSGYFDAHGMHLLEADLDPIDD